MGAVSTWLDVHDPGNRGNELAGLGVSDRPPDNNLFRRLNLRLLIRETDHLPGNMSRGRVCAAVLNHDHHGFKITH